MRVEAVFLDFGGTLAYREEGIWELFSQVCRGHGIMLTRSDIDRGRALADRTHRSVQFQTQESMEFFWAEWFRLMLENLGVDGAEGIAEEIYTVIKEKSNLYLYEEVKGVLSRLSRIDIGLGIVSNYNCLLEPNCVKLGISDYFDFILASDLIRSGKPHPLIFNLAVEEAGVEKGRCVHIGDSYGADYDGARKAGLQALLLDRPGTEREVCPKISDLWGVLDYIQPD